MSVLKAFDEDSRRVVVLAQEVARAYGAAQVELCHVLAGIIRVSGTPAAVVLGEAGVREPSDVPQLADVPSGEAPRGSLDPLPFSADTRRTLEQSLQEAARLGSSSVAPEHILLAVSSDLSAPLSFLGFPAPELRARLMRAMAGMDRPVPVGAGSRPRRPETGRVLERFGRDLTFAAEDGKLLPVLGRDEEISRICQVLARQVKSNPLLIGDPGVGKTAIVEGLAQRITEGSAPHFLNGRRLIQLDLTSMIAGARYRGDFEERIRAALEEARKDPSVLLFIDEAHVLVGAGAAEGAIDASSILKPLLARGEIQLIGATTFDEYRKHIAKDGALERRFQSVEIKEPALPLAEKMLEGLIPGLREHHGVDFSPEAARSAARLSHRYLPDRRLPDKGLDLLDESAARLRASGRLDEPVTEQDLAETLAAWTGIDASRISQDESDRLSSMEDALSRRVIGQQEAVSSVSRAVRRSRTGMKDPRRPAGSFLFAGPSGVGKTELAKTLAEFLFGSDDALIRFDMSEYQEKHTVSRLIGAPPGYVGHDEGGQLTEAVRRRPYCVLLLDEVEKAHPDVFNLLLQMFEEGDLTDGQGRKVDFRNTIVVLTSNLGTEQMAALEVGFAGASGTERERMRLSAEREIARFFRPELRNRMDETIVFAPLPPETVVEIAAGMVDALSARLAEQGASVHATEAFVAHLAALGYDPALGARPLRRVIQSEMIDPIADLMVSGNLPAGSTVKFDMVADAPDVSVVRSRSTTAPLVS